MTTSTRKLVIKHNFEGVMVMMDVVHESDITETILDTKWHSFAFGDRNGGITTFFRFCVKEEVIDKKVEIKVTNRFIDKNGDINEYTFLEGTYDAGFDYYFDCVHTGTETEWYRRNTTTALEHHIEMKGVFPLIEVERRKKKDFGTEESRLTDVALVLEGEKFFVAKATLAAFSSYFKSMFFGGFVEGQKSEVELIDVAPETFQLLLEIIYHVPDVNDENVEDILELARMYDVKIAIAECERHLIRRNYLPLDVKLRLAKEYRMYNLEDLCTAEMAKEDELQSRIIRRSRTPGHEGVAE